MYTDTHRAHRINPRQIVQPQSCQALQSVELKMTSECDEQHTSAVTCKSVSTYYHDSFQESSQQHTHLTECPYVHTKRNSDHFEERSQQRTHLTECSYVHTKSHHNRAQNCAAVLSPGRVRVGTPAHRMSAPDVCPLYT